MWIHPVTGTALIARMNHVFSLDMLGNIALLGALIAAHRALPVTHADMGHFALDLGRQV